GALRRIAAEANVVGIEATGARLAGPLGPVEGALGELEQRRGAVCVHGEDGDPGGDGEIGAVGRELSDGEPDPLGELHGRLAIRAWEDQGELLAADARRRVAPAD